MKPILLRVVLSLVLARVDLESHSCSPRRQKFTSHPLPPSRKQYKHQRKRYCCFHSSFRLHLHKPISERPGKVSGSLACSYRKHFCIELPFALYVSGKCYRVPEMSKSIVLNFMKRLFNSVGVVGEQNYYFSYPGHSFLF